MADRTSVEEISSVVTLLIQSERFGAGIVEALRTCARTMRELRSQQAEEAAEKTAVKLLFPMVAFIFPALLIVMVGARNVSRIRVVGVEPSHAGALDRPRTLARGEELARLELGSTIVLLTAPECARPSPTLVPGLAVRLGEPIGRWQGEAR
jgi:hypothetical protein